MVRATSNIVSNRSVSYGLVLTELNTFLNSAAFKSGSSQLHDPAYLSSGNYMYDGRQGEPQVRLGVAKMKIRTSTRSRSSVHSLSLYRLSYIILPSLTQTLVQLFGENNRAELCTCFNLWEKLPVMGYHYSSRHQIASRPRKDFTPPYRAAQSQQSSVARFVTLRVLSCLHSHCLCSAVCVATLYDFVVTLKLEVCDRYYNIRHCTTRLAVFCYRCWMIGTIPLRVICLLTSIWELRDWNTQTYNFTRFIYRICACISRNFLTRIYPPQLGCGLCTEYYVLLTTESATPLL
jgi:hypothetical protein